VFETSVIELFAYLSIYLSNGFPTTQSISKPVCESRFCHVGLRASEPAESHVGNRYLPPQVSVRNL